MPRKGNHNAAPILRMAVPSPLRRCFDYLPPRDSTADDWNQFKPGMRMRVPFGRRQVTAVLTEISLASEVDHSKLRRVIQVLDFEPLFSDALMKCLRWAAGYYQHPPGEVFSALMPAKLRQGIAASLEPEIVWVPEQVDQGVVENLLRRAPRQMALWQFIRHQGKASRADCRNAGFTTQLVESLLQKQLLRMQELPPVAPEPAVTPQALTPNTEQQQAIDSIIDNLGGYQCHLLDGITGSGKTEVYLQVIAEVLRQGQQALLLIPEISLTPQTIAVFSRRFSCPITVLHSRLSDTERLSGWLKARDGQAKIVIGTRSAVFTPLAQPGIIIIDEEHDLSFKQQDGFRYSARDLAIVRAREEKISIVLGSATPSLESLHNVQAGKFTHLQLTGRAGSGRIAPIQLLDIEQAEMRNGFSNRLLTKMSDHLQQDNQVLVFINRRGFAPTLFCQDCGFICECHRCDIQLTVHRHPPSLHCHHCESRSPIPPACPGCASKRLATRGVGTEKIEQFLQLAFPVFPIFRIDRDTTRNRNQLDEMLTIIRDDKPGILVGTQMLAKGHHFPRVTLVAVLDADTGLFSPDFRGQEHMVQLLFQVAGRAGRSDRRGEVLVQTRHSSHRILQSLETGSYNAIAGLLLEERKSAGMPPYSHLAVIRSEAVEFRLALALLNQVFASCENAISQCGLKGISLHRPIPSPMEKRAGKFRAQMLLQSKSRNSLNTLLTSVCQQVESMKSARKTRWSIDVDPQDLI